MGGCLGGLELGRVAGWLRNRVALTATKERELSEVTAPVEVCGCILYEVGCTDSLLFKEMVGGDDLYDLFVLLLTNKMWRTFGQVNN